jgi:hypothetical protein
MPEKQQHTMRELEGEYTAHVKLIDELRKENAWLKKLVDHYRLALIQADTALELRTQLTNIVRTALNTIPE